MNHIHERSCPSGYGCAYVATCWQKSVAVIEKWYVSALTKSVSAISLFTTGNRIPGKIQNAMRYITCEVGLIITFVFDNVVLKKKAAGKSLHWIFAPLRSVKTSELER